MSTKMTNMTQEFADSLYAEAGTLVPEDSEAITIDRYGYLLNDKIHNIIQEVLRENPLPFELQDFQKLTLHCLGSMKNVILISPTGTGKLICAFILSINHEV